MNWVSRKIHLYNVTMGLYMLDWWERYLFMILGKDYSLILIDILILVLLWFICYNGSRFVSQIYNGHPMSKFMLGGNSGIVGGVPS